MGKNKKDFWVIVFEKYTALDPPDRLSEVLFGLIMVLTFTGTISATAAGNQEVKELLWAALGCNFAWGMVDGIMYLMDTTLGRSRDALMLKKIKNAKTAVDSRQIIRENLSPLMGNLMDDSELDGMGNKMKRLPELRIKNTLTVKDFLIAVEIFFLVFLSTFPVVLPFLFFSEINVALRVSNAVAILLMFAAGYSLAKYSGLRPFKTALIYTGLGLLLVAMTLILGG